MSQFSRRSLLGRAIGVLGGFWVGRWSAPAQPVMSDEVAQRLITCADLPPTIDWETIYQQTHPVSVSSFPLLKRIETVKVLEIVPNRLVQVIDIPGFDTAHQARFSQEAINKLARDLADEIDRRALVVYNAVTFGEIVR